MLYESWAAANISLPAGASGEVRLLCPQCASKRRPAHQSERELAVNVEQATWMCHHCGWSGGIARVPGAIKATRKEYEPPRPVPVSVPPTLWENTVAFFQRRGISEATLTSAGVTVANEKCPVCEAEVGHILFPYYRNGAHVNTKHRCGKKHFRMERGAERVLWNIDACAGAETIYVVEGEPDALSLMEIGIPNVVSVPDGAPAPNAKNYASKFAFLESAEDLFAHAKRVVLACDADEPGRLLTDELARRIGPEKCSRVRWGNGIKDANECLVQHGRDELWDRLSHAELYPVEGIFTGLDFVDDLVSFYEHGDDPGTGFGYPRLDEHYRICLGHLSVWVGIPSHGKSTVLDQLLVKLAEDHDWRFALFSPEQQPLSRHQRTLIQQHVGKPIKAGYRERMTVDEMLWANEWAAEHFSYILPEETSIDHILELARTEVYRRGVKGIVIDPWNELEHARPRHMTETEYTGEALIKFRRFARNHDVHLWIVAHPTKMRRVETSNGTEAEPVPNLWDISGSAHFRNKADVGVTVWRDLVNGPHDVVQIHITKMRWEDNGQLGTVRFGYDAASKRLYELGE